MARKKDEGKMGFWAWIQSPEAGKYSGRVVLGIFITMFLGIATLVKVGSVTADATAGVEVSKDGINEVRMTSIDYVFTYDDSVSSEKKEAIRMYVYSSMDAVKLLHMVNMRQKVVFTETKEEVFIDGDIVYVPTSTSSDELWETLALLD